MPVHVDPSLPVHPLTVDDIDAMLRAGILSVDDHVELVDGVLVEMSPQGGSHAYAVRRLAALAFPLAARAGLELSVQSPLDIGSPVTQPEPDLVIAPVAGRDRHPTAALLVVEVGASSMRLDLGRKAGIYAAAGVPEYWVLDLERRALVVHRQPSDGRYADVRTFGEHETAVAATLDLVVPVAGLL